MVIGLVGVGDVFAAYWNKYQNNSLEKRQRFILALTLVYLGFSLSIRALSTPNAVVKPASTWPFSVVIWLKGASARTDNNQNCAHAVVIKRCFNLGNGSIEGRDDSRFAGIAGAAEVVVYLNCVRIGAGSNNRFLGFIDSAKYEQQRD